MPEAFRSLASILAGGAPPQSVAAPPSEPSDAARDRATHQAARPPADGRVRDLLDTFVADLARLRARAAERFEECAEALLAELARCVLGRELATAPADIETLVSEALGEFDDRCGVIVHVGPADAERLGARWPVRAQPGLAPGDFVVEVDDGRYDATLQTRLDALLATHRVGL